MPCHECGFIDNNGSVPKSKIQVIFCKKHSSGFMASTQMLFDSRGSTKKLTFSQTSANSHTTAINLSLSFYFI
jgi:hypothetical protein